MKIQTRRGDAITAVRAQWKREQPDLNTRPLETIGRILRIQFLAAARIRRLLQRYGIDAGGFDVLATLRRRGPPYRMTPTGLYTDLVLTSGAMTHRIDVLETAGLVKRQRDPSDRRGTLIELTAAGKTLAERAMAAHMEAEGDWVAHLSGEEQSRLAGLLHEILAGLEEE